jgi:polar amino acid transport system substrate-binding protein
LAPGGKIRAAINLSNVVLAKGNGANPPTGITPDIAHELGRRLGVPVELVPFDGAGKVFAAANSGAWDIAFLAIEPKRADELEFTAPYVIIEGTYMVPADSPLRKVEDVDRPGRRIGVTQGAAYDLFLTRSLQHATLVRGKEGFGGVAESFASGIDAIGGVRQALDGYAKSNPGVRVMADRFMEIRQAMAASKGRKAGAAYLHAFIEDLKASGFIAEAILRNNQSATVAPPG